jgi:hypothetical protein
MASEVLKLHAERFTNVSARREWELNPQYRASALRQCKPFCKPSISTKWQSDLESSGREAASV